MKGKHVHSSSVKYEVKTSHVWNISQYDVKPCIPVTLEGCTSFFDQTGVVLFVLRLFFLLC